MPALRALRKLRSLSPRELSDLLRAQFALLRTQWRVKSVPVGTLVVRDVAPVNEEASGERVRARELGLAVARAAEYGVFRPFCLVRALALQTMLNDAGIRGSSVRVGVRRVSGKFSAHAWVMWRGEVLGDRADHVSTFMEVDDLRVLSDS